MPNDIKRCGTHVYVTVAGLWVLMSLIPYFVVGESWGSVWFMINRPLSSILKSPLWEFGRGVYVFVVTMANAAVLCALLSLISLAVRRKSDNVRKNGILDAPP